MWAWLWQSDTFSDVKLKLVAPSSSSSPNKKVKLELGAPVATHSGKALLELSAHRVVLGSASTHFKERLVAWGKQQQQQQQQGQDGSVSQQDGAGQEGGNVVAVLEEEVALEHLPAARATLQFMYLQELPTDLSIMTVIMVARLAERWGMPQCMHACMALLSALKPSELPADVIGSVLSDDVPRSIMEQPGFTPLLAACRKRLGDLFGSAQAVLLDEPLRTSFCSLPFSALRLWAQLDELHVDSENSVALLLTHWWAAHYPPAAKPAADAAAAGAKPPAVANGAAAAAADEGATGSKRTVAATGAAGVVTLPAPPSSQTLQQQMREQREQVSTWVRLNQLSATYFVSVLPQLPWWSPPQEPFALLSIARVLHQSRGNTLQPAIRSRLPAAWLAKARAKDPSQVVQLTWTITVAELEALHKSAGSMRSVRESPGLCWCGYMWHLCLSLNSQKDALWVGAKVRSALPSTYQMPVIMEAKFTLAVKEAATAEFTRKETLNFGDGAALQPGNCNGTPRLLSVPAAPAPRANSTPPAALLHDGKLSMMLIMENMQ